MRIATKAASAVLLTCAVVLCWSVAADTPSTNWTHFVRIGAYGLKSDNAEEIVGNATKDHVFGIEVDNDIPGRYESFLDPTEKLKAIRAVAEAAHKVHNHAFVYIAGTECITANADKGAHSVVKDHPDWLQRKITGEPAVFTSGAAFWISPGDEDVWISPYAKDWRKIYMQRVRQIAETGIDGIYVDIPYWMTHFDGWEQTWASFDDATVNAFREKTGLDARKDLKLGDFHDESFRKWIDFRLATFTDFLQEIRDNARAVNPNIVLIPEIYPGVEEEATRVGADVYQIYGVADAIAHEYEFGSGEHMAASRTQLDWFLYQAGMLSFRAFAQGKPTWILNYSWDGDKNVDAREAMKNLAMSQVIAGANFWDAPGHSMAGSNNEATRTEIFKWIEKNENELYRPRLPVRPIGVYFSPKSRDYDAQNFLPSYRGLLVMLLQTHREFQVITPRTLANFQGEVLVVPNASVMSAAEKEVLRSFVGRGGRLVVTGEDAAKLGDLPQIVRFADCPEKAYLAALQQDFERASARLPDSFLRTFDQKDEVRVEALPTVATNVGRVNGTTHVYLANFGGLVPSKVAIPTPATGIVISVPAGEGNAMDFLPFLGERQTLHGVKKNDRMEFSLPPVERGAVAWIERSK